ncbi:MAG: restriction endonuclease [Clostridia bacterium]|nr:restriction endonuclease [Clostridia bacterium]
MEGTRYKTKEAVLQRAKEVIGLPLKTVDKTGRLSTGKGAIGTVIEESWYGYTPNSESEPDFPEAGVELKVTPYIRSNGNIRAKERLVCNIINYMEEYKRTFKTSSFWHKCNTMLLMSYEHKDGVPKGELAIDEAVLFSFPEEDLVIIEQDWEMIMNKIRGGQAHTISEGDTLYLAACTKGANANSVRSQPFSDTKAKQRAYSLKSSYMTQILNSYIFGSIKNERIIKDPRALFDTTFERYIEEKLRPYYGKTISQLRKMFDVDSNAKNIVEILLAKMLGVSGNISHTEEFKKAGIVPKTVRLLPNGRSKESMSFPTFDFIKIVNEKWEDSALYDTLSSTKFMFVVFQSEYTDDPNEMTSSFNVVKGGKEQTAPSGATEFKFKKVQFWNMPDEDLEEVHRVWDKTVQTIKKGVTLTQTEKGVSNDLPKQSESPVAHVRPHGKDGNDKLPLPDGRMMAKQCFWLNANYIAEQVRD